MQHNKFNIDELFNYLIEKKSPVMEIEILRHFNKKSNLPHKNPELFNIHFSLFHSLYNLKQKAGMKGYYLHIDPMRIRLLEISQINTCNHYDPKKGFYCEKRTYSDNYCEDHYHLYNKNIPVYDPLLEFYNNFENIVFGESKLLNKLMDGVIVYAFKKGEIDKALNFFGITSPNKKIIQKKYHELARIYHPDIQNGNHKMMKELNKYYQILQEVFVV